MASRRKLSRANSAIKSPRKSLPSTVNNARKSTPTSVLSGGKQYFGPLYRGRLGFDK
jgi:hypothetical protein